MQIITPAPPPYDPHEWSQRPWSERIKLAAQAWAIQGYGTPVGVYAVYLLKVLAYVGGWVFFCGFTEGLGGITDLRSWMFQPIAFQKAVLWSMAFEGLGLGCASGPLTGRYHPPVTAPLHFLRPGTIRLPLFPGARWPANARRTWLDVGLYALHYVLLLRALTAPALDASMFWPTVVVLPLIGLRDKTIFLAARGEHYYTTLVCFLFVKDWIAGAMAVQLAIWVWAATSKLNRHFPAVICVMTSNSPVLAFPWLRKRMYKGYPEDLRPAWPAHAAAHLGTLAEYTFPVLLAVGSGGTLTTVGLVMMVLFHAYITSNIPMAVPIEWERARGLWWPLSLWSERARLGAEHQRAAALGLLGARAGGRACGGQCVAGQDLLFGVHALLRGQLGLQRLALQGRQL